MKYPALSNRSSERGMFFGWVIIVEHVEATDHSTCSSGKAPFLVFVFLIVTLFVSAVLDLNC